MYDNLTTLKFNFDMTAVTAKGLTTDELLAPMREYAQQNGISEPEYGLFALPTNENSYCKIINWVISYTLNNSDFPNYFNSIISTIDEEVEDCLPDLKEM